MTSASERGVFVVRHILVPLQLIISSGQVKMGSFGWDALSSGCDWQLYGVLHLHVLPESHLALLLLPTNEFQNFQIVELPSEMFTADLQTF